MTSVSVVIPVYNRAHSICRAVDSALAQGEGASAVNVIVVDDGSSDNLEAALAPYEDRVRLLRHQSNAGAAAARNTGVMAATDEFVAFLDSDDMWLPGKLATQLAAMRDQGWRASCTSYLLCRDGKKPLVSPQYESGPLGLDDLVWGCFVSPGTTLVFERAVFAEIGPFFTELARLEDWDWLLRFCSRYPLGFVAEPLAQITASSFSDATKLLPAIELLRTRHLPNLPQRLRRYLAAALDMEKAAALYRAGSRFGAMLPLVSSLGRVPVGHKAIAAVLYNRWGSGFTPP